MPNNYTYNIQDRGQVDLTELQKEELEEKGYEYNSQASSWDLYENVFENIEMINFDYTEDKEFDAQLSLVEVIETTKVKDALYKENGKGFFSLFKKIKQTFFPKKEENVSDSRILELEKMLAEKKIYDLEIKEKFKSIKIEKKLTQKELSLMEESYTFIKKLKETKKEIQELIHSETTTLKEFDDNYSYLEEDGRILYKEIYTEKKLIEKIVVDRRKKISITQRLYIPGIWSNLYNHQYGTMASFIGEVDIFFISGYNPYDYDMVNLAKEELIEKIGEQESNIENIRKRNDGKDGFKIEFGSVENI